MTQIIVYTHNKKEREDKIESAQSALSKKERDDVLTKTATCKVSAEMPIFDKVVKVQKLQFTACPTSGHTGLSDCDKCVVTL